MKVILFLCLMAAIVQWIGAVNPHGADVEDNDFAEFEDFDDEEEKVVVEDAQKEEPVRVIMSSQADEADLMDEEDATVEDEEDEFEHLQDDEEFEGFDNTQQPKPSKGQDKQPDLKVAKIPLHLRTNWDSFYMEMLMLAGLGVYFLNFLAGKTKNGKLAQTWFMTHKTLLEENFHVVGDDGTTTEVQTGVLMKESENVYSLWCSGRVCCEGMLVTLKLLKRQDLVSTISRLFKPASDQIIVKVTLDETEMDTFVFFLANKKVCSKMHKEMLDLSLFCNEKKSVEKLGLPSNFQLLSEIGEATSAILDSRVIAALKKYESMVEYIHISDKFAGVKQQEDGTPSKMPETSKVLIFCFNVPGKGKNTPQDMQEMRPLMQMVFHCIDKVRRIRLSREAKTKADKNRQKVEEQFLKASHAQRQEAAQQRREDKRRAEKERIMNEEDPDKQRKWEEKENRREAKKKQPKVKMMKMKAM